MAGHNKWSKVKRFKAVVDAKRGKIFSKFSKEITLAAKSGGGTRHESRLRSAILAAKAQNMPNDNIDRAVKKGTGELAGAALEEIMCEGYGPGGAAFLIEVVTDNRNRSAQDLRVLLSKNNGTFADAGSVAYQFTRRGEIHIDKGDITEDQMMERALEAGAEDILDSDDEWIVYTAVDQLFNVGNSLRDAGMTPKTQELTYHAATTVTVDDPEAARQLVKLYDALDDYDDTQNLHYNFEIPDEIAETLG